MNLARFYDLAERHISSFCGIEYADGNLAEAVTVLKEGRNVLLGSDTVLVAGLSLGLDSAILTTLNICPEYVSDIYDSICNNKLHDAQEAQKKLNQRVWDITKMGKLDWNEAMKTEFNKVNPQFQCGPWRKTTTFKTAI